MAGDVEVQVGQIWQDWDVRVRDHKTARQVKVVFLIRMDADPFAEVVTSYDGGKTWGTGVRRIKLRRFRPTSTGYKLVKDRPGVPILCP